MAVDDDILMKNPFGFELAGIVVNTEHTSGTMTYQELLDMFGPFYQMPAEEAMKGDVVEYRCPYTPKCPARANCFVAATSKPLQDGDILNVKCRLCGNKKIPVFAKAAAVLKKNK